MLAFFYHACFGVRRMPSASRSNRDLIDGEPILPRGVARNLVDERELKTHRATEDVTKDFIEVGEIRLPVAATAEDANGKVVRGILDELDLSDLRSFGD